MLLMRFYILIVLYCTSGTCRVDVLLLIIYWLFGVDVQYGISNCI